MTIDRRYWDSDCFLAWLQSEEGKADACREVLEAADEGKILLITSALTLAEVLYLRGDGQSRRHGRMSSWTSSRTSTSTFATLRAT